MLKAHFYTANKRVNKIVKFNLRDKTKILPQMLYGYDP